MSLLSPLSVQTLFDFDAAAPSYDNVDDLLFPLDLNSLSGCWSSCLIAQHTYLRFHGLPLCPSGRLGQQVCFGHGYRLQRSLSVTCRQLVAYARR